MLKKDFNDISIRGRVAFGIMCFERYVKDKYHDADFSPVCHLMWGIVSDKDFIDASAERYMEIIPEYLYEFDDYDEAEFDYLSTEEFNAMRKLIPNDDQSLEIIMHRIYDTAMEHAYSAIKAPAKASIDYVFEIAETLGMEGVTPPDIESVKRFSFAESGGWGAPISYEGLSIILH